MKHPTIKEIKDYHNQLTSITNPLEISNISDELKHLMKVIEYFGSDNDNLCIEFTKQYTSNFDEEYIENDDIYEVSIDGFHQFNISFIGNKIFMHRIGYNKYNPSTFLIDEFSQQFNQDQFNNFLYSMFLVDIEYLKKHDIPIEDVEAIEIHLPKIKDIINANQYSLGLELFKGLFETAQEYINNQLPF